MDGVMMKRQGKWPARLMDGHGTGIQILAIHCIQCDHQT